MLENPHHLQTPHGSGVCVSCPQLSPKPQHGQLPAHSPLTGSSAHSRAEVLLQLSPCRDLEQFQCRLAQGLALIQLAAPMGPGACPGCPAHPAHHLPCPHSLSLSQPDTTDSARAPKHFISFPFLSAEVPGGGTWGLCRGCCSSPRGCEDIEELL